MRYLIVALVVSLCWLHQDWLVWPLLADVQKEHDLMLGIPAGLGYHVAISFAAAAVWFLAVWKAWPTELEQWAGTGSNRRGGRGRSNRGDRSRQGNRTERTQNKDDGGNENRPRRRGGRGGRGRRRSGPGPGNGGPSQSSSNPA